MEPLPLDTPIISHSLSETENLAARFYGMIFPCALAGLYGPLGAGKTCFVRGVARAAGVARDEVSSPSFMLINEYHGGRTPIFHFDLYRIKDPAEFRSIGADEYLNRDGIILIEWAENGHGHIPEKRYNIYFGIIDEHTRQLTFSRSNL